MKKVIIIGVAILIVILFALAYIFKTPQISVINDCKMRCENNKAIPCQVNDDCDTDTMMKFCNQEKTIFKNGFDGYCKDGYCQAYGCGGVPAID